VKTHHITSENASSLRCALRYHPPNFS